MAGLVDKSEVRDLAAGVPLEDIPVLTAANLTGAAGTDATIIDNINARLREVTTKLDKLGIVEDA